MNEECQGYMNERVLKRWNELHSGRLAYVRLLPDLEAGMVIMVPSITGKEYGAEPVKYTETENGAMVNLRRAIRKMNVKRMPGRTRIFPVVDRTAPDGRIYLAFVVKDTETRPSRKRNAAEGAAGTGGGPAATPNPEAQS